MSEIDVPVLIVGSGPAGMMASILLRQQGIEAKVIDRRSDRSRAPAAHVVNARTFEICRSAGIDMEAMMKLTGDPADAGSVHWVTRLAGEVIASLPFERQDDAVLELTPTPLRNLAQHRFESVLHQHLDSGPGDSAEFGQQWESAVQGPDGVISSVRDLGTDAVHEIRSRYLIAADGAGSRIRESLAIGMIGPPKLQSFVMIHFRADLRALVGDHPGILYWIADPEVGGAFVAHNIDSEWVYMHSVDADAESDTEYTPERCHELVLRGIAADASAIDIPKARSPTQPMGIGKMLRHLGAPSPPRDDYCRSCGGRTASSTNTGR